jgi:hypothetical protein
MNTTADGRYRFRRHTAPRHGVLPLAYAEFNERFSAQSDTDLTPLLPPSADLAWKFQGPRFPLGQLCVTPGAAAAVPLRELLAALARHVTGDWGQLDTHDREVNERALAGGGRLCSVYQTLGGQRYWVITDAGHQVTTVLLPEEY